MLVWHDVRENPIPVYNNGLVYFLAIHKTFLYTSDVYMCWSNKDGSVARWPHNDISITHWAYINLPE